MDKKEIQLNLSRNHVTRQKSEQTHRFEARRHNSPLYYQWTNNFF